VLASSLFDRSFTDTETDRYHNINLSTRARGNPKDWADDIDMDLAEVSANTLKRLYSPKSSAIAETEVLFKRANEC
jgi:hypothetical protein